MTREEAVEYWQEFDREIYDMLDKIVFDEEYELLIKQREVVEFTLASLRVQQEQERNDPLTLDELREMDGEPVWLKIANGVWALVDTNDSVVWLDRGGSIDIVKIVGKAYRRKQEEG